MTYSETGGPCILVWGPTAASGRPKWKLFRAGREPSRLVLCVSLFVHLVISPGFQLSAAPGFVLSSSDSAAHELWPARLPVHGIVQAGVLEEVPFPPQGILPTQGSHPRVLPLLHPAVGSLPLHRLGNPKNSTFSSSFYRGENSLCLLWFKVH